MWRPCIAGHIHVFFAINWSPWSLLPISPYIAHSSRLPSSHHPLTALLQDSFLYLVSDGVTDMIEDAAGCQVCWGGMEQAFTLVPHLTPHLMSEDAAGCQVCEGGMEQAFTFVSYFTPHLMINDAAGCQVVAEQLARGGSASQAAAALVCGQEGGGGTEGKSEPE